jgi:hypothetical protein
MTVKKAKLLTRVGVSSAFALGLALTFQPGPASALAVSVTPSTNLVDGQSVTVSGTGLTPGTVYHIGECAPVDSTIACNQPEGVDVTADSAGTATATLTVRKTFVGLVGAPPGTPVGTIDCGTQACLVGFGDDAGNGGGVPISFR